MKSKLVTISVVGAAHFLIFWAAVGLLKASGFKLFTLESALGFSAAPPITAAQDFLFAVMGILTYPMAWISAWSPDRWPAVFLAVLINSAAWGLVLGLLIYAINQRVRRKALG